MSVSGSIAFLLLLALGIVLIVLGVKHLASRPTKGFDKENIRAIIALVVTYLILLFALLDYLVGQRVLGYIAVVFAAVLIWYFGSRAFDIFVSARASGFTFQKTFPDGTREKISNYGQSDINLQHLAALQQSIETLQESIEAVQAREKKGWGFVYGTLTFASGVKDKTGVQLTLVGTSFEGEAVTKNAGRPPRVLTSSATFPLEVIV